MMGQDIVCHSVARRRVEVIVRTTSVAGDSSLSARAGLRPMVSRWSFG